MIIIIRVSSTRVLNNLKKPINKYIVISYELLRIVSTNWDVTRHCSMVESELLVNAAYVKYNSIIYNLYFHIILSMVLYFY